MKLTLQLILIICIREWMILITFLKTGRISYNMLKYIPVLAQIAYQGHLHSIETKENMQMTLTNLKKLSNLMFSLLK